MKAPPRYKAHADLTPDEVLRELQAARRGVDVRRAETDEYRAHKANVLAAGGLTDEAAAVRNDGDELATKPIEDWSPAEHADHLRRGR